MSLVILFGFLIVLGVLSWLIAFSARGIAFKFHAVDEPRGGRKIHTKPTPLFGGLGIGVLLIAAIAMVSSFVSLGHIRPFQLSGFLLGLSILLIGGLLDDKFDLPPTVQVIFPILAAIFVILTGTTIPQVTQWIGHGGYSLTWWQHSFSLLGLQLTISWPADVLAFFWLLGVTYAMKFLDGLDGLVTGQTIIGAVLIAALAFTHAYYQPEIVLLALIVAAVYLGFLPHNIFPAKQFLGEAGSLIAGFSLAFLAIVSGAKVATALMALGLPLADASLVVLGRLARGASPFRGDDTHLHFKLLKAGLSQRQVVIILWAIAFLFGLLAFGVQTKGKVLLLIVLFGVTILLPIFVTVMRRSRSPKVS